MEAPTSTLQDDEDLKMMMAGSDLIKVRSTYWKKQRHFRLLEDSMTILYRSRKGLGLFGKGHSTFSATDVESVREGHQSELLATPEIAAEFPADLCFTLAFQGRQGTLDLVAETPEEAQAWICGMRKLIEKAENMDENERLDQWVWDWFQKADRNSDGRIEFKETCKMLKMMNMDMDEDHAFRLFTMADRSANTGLEIDEFVQFYRMLTQRDEVWKVFQDYSEDGEILTLEELESFLAQEQQEGERSAKYARELIDRYEPSDETKQQGALSLDGFQMYLCSQEDGSIFINGRRDLYQDMSQPLSHYFISTSHNTYLMADQLIGQSSQEAYIQAFKRGCRCIEVDCWDGSDGQPIVYHGHTLTSRIPYRDVIATIGEYAFMASNFPVIISIENHCGVDQQTIMAQYLEEILGDALLKSTLDGEVPEKLPSPQELQGKILVKAKKIGRLEPSSGDTTSDEGSDEDEDDETSEDGDSESQERKRTENRDTATLSSELSDLVVYCKTVSFHGFEHSLLHSKCYEMSSYSENKAKKLVRDEGTPFVRHNTKHLSRIYPKGTRTDSSNYRPHEMWNGGCQLVALNYQTAGLSMDLNDGIFAQNGGSGYVLKPDFMRDSDTLFDPERPEDRPGYRPLNLSIRVISGQQLPKVKQRSIVDPLVRVEVYGVPLDEAQLQTRTLKNNGFNPVWNDTLDFVIHTPELALVRFVVEDYDMAGTNNNFIGQFTLPFDCIQAGYRHISLLSEDGTTIPQASLFVNVSISDYIPESEM